MPKRQTGMLTEALQNLSDANADVTASLNAAAEAVNAQKDSPLEGEALDTYVKNFTEAELTAAVNAAEADVDTEQSEFDAAIAQRSNARTETFASPSASVQGASISTEATALINDTDLNVAGSDRLTDANIAQALADAQAKVNADATEYAIITSAVSGKVSGSEGDAAKVVEIWASGGTGVAAVTSATPASADTAFAVAGSSSGYFDLEGNKFAASGSAFKTSGSAGTSIAKSDMTTAKALQTALINAEGALASDESANGSNVELLKDLRSAITDFVADGGDLATSAASSSVDFTSVSGVSGSAASGADIATLLNVVNQVLNNEDAAAQKAAAEDVVGLFGTISGSAYAGKFDQLSENDSTFNAINAAIDAIEQRVLMAK